MAVTQYKPYRLTKKVGQRKFRQLIPASYDTFEYVSLGDSICAGHAIDRGWYDNYGVAVQYNKSDLYGNNRGNCLTTLLPNTYTALLQKELQRAMPSKKVNATSFGHSGATVDDLVIMLREGTKVAQAAGKINTTKTYYYGDNPMTEALRKADLVTISIGANAFLSPGMSYVENSIAEYLYSGTSAKGFGELENVFNGAISTLGNGGASSGHISVLGKTYTYTYSYLDLIETLYLVNPNATYRFTSVHNPFRCFYLDNNFIRGFFNWFWDWLGDLFSQTIENSIEWKTVQSNAAYLSPWVGMHIDQMNEKLDSAAKAFTWGKFEMTPVKELFDAVPDRPGSGDIKYNDLINVQITKGFTGPDLNWGALWYNDELGTDGVWSYAEKFVTPYLNDLSTMLSTVIGHMTKYELNYIMDPHPRNAGHEIIYRIFSDSLSSTYGTTKLNKITYNPNGGSGTAFTQKYVGSLSNADNAGKKVATITRGNGFGSQSGYRFVGWSTSSGEKSPTVPNASEQIFSGDVSLHSQWSNQCIIKFKHSNYTGTSGAINGWIVESLGAADWSGHGQCYGLWVNGVEMPDFEGFNDSNSSYEDVYSVPYGSQITVKVSDYTGEGLWSNFYNHKDCQVILNGVQQAGGKQNLEYGFTLTCDMEIDFRWQVAGTLINTTAQSWEDCYMTTFDASYQDLRQPYTVSFEANGGTGSMPTQKILQLGSRTVKTTLLPLSYSHPDNTYRFTGWHAANNEKPYDKQLIYMSANWHLVAQWSNTSTLTIKQSDSSFMGVNLSEFSGNILGISYNVPLGDNYADREIYIGGNKVTLNEFDSKGSTTQTISVQTGTPIGIRVRSKDQSGNWIWDWFYDVWNCWIKDANHTTRTEGASTSATIYMPPNDVTIELEFKSNGSWATRDAKVCWDAKVYGVSEFINSGSW